MALPVIYIIITPPLSFFGQKIACIQTEMHPHPILIFKKKQEEKTYLPVETAAMISCHSPTPVLKKITVELNIGITSEKQNEWFLEKLGFPLAAPNR